MLKVDKEELYEEAMGILYDEAIEDGLLPHEAENHAYHGAADKADEMYAELEADYGDWKREVERDRMMEFDR
jgi:hypothetical protein